jgi:hypothetical protein
VPGLQDIAAMSQFQGLTRVLFHQENRSATGVDFAQCIELTLRRFE